MTLFSNNNTRNEYTARVRFGVIVAASALAMLVGCRYSGSSRVDAAAESGAHALPSEDANPTPNTTPAYTGKKYYLSPTGSDHNSGLTTSLPWLTPNHPLTCGDVITAASGKYSAADFNTGKWGEVSCPSENNVAWLQCAKFDTCKIATSSSDGMWVDESFWGVQGWEVTTSSDKYGACFHVGPGSETVHHVIFANNVANGCMGSGFTAYDRSPTDGVDYIAFIGNIAYNAAQGNGACYSGFNIYQPVAYDRKTGTHILIAGNFSWGNIDANPCADTAPTDGEGINIDTWDFSQGGGSPYAQQGVVENNIEFLNGGDGIEVENNIAGGTNATVYIKHNTQYGDRRDAKEGYCVGNGEIHLYKASNVTVTRNLVYTGFQTGCQGKAIYAIAVANSDASNVINDNFAAGVDGNQTFLYSNQSLKLGTGNTLGTNPAFAHAATSTSAPSCGNSANVPACMATVIQDFIPNVSAAKSYGYQKPSPNKAYDPLFPQWLCSTVLPAGLMTIGCQ